MLKNYILLEDKEKKSRKLEGKKKKIRQRQSMSELKKESVQMKAFNFRRSHAGKAKIP